MLDVSEQRARADHQLLNAIAKRVELERELRQNLDQMQLGALKENICVAARTREGKTPPTSRLSTLSVAGNTQGSIAPTPRRAARSRNKTMSTYLCPVGRRASQPF
jgi:hypothetical protein